MDDLLATYKDDQSDDTTPTIPSPATDPIPPETDIPSEELSDNPNNPKSPNFTKIISSEEDNETETEPEPPSKKLKNILEESTPNSTPIAPPTVTNKHSKKKKYNKSKGNNVWTKPTSRKGKKRTKSTTTATAQTTEDSVLITPVHRFADKTDDSVEMRISLSKVYKAEKVELSEDRLTAGSCKGYRMVRATRGVNDGNWYFEIKVMTLGETGHTRLGWCNEKGDLQAPVGYDGNSYGYRDIDGSKVHKAVREKYGEEGYGEGDVIGFYISLPDGKEYAPKQPQLVLYKGQKYAYASDTKDEPPKVVPGNPLGSTRMCPMLKVKRTTIDIAEAD